MIKARIPALYPDTANLKDVGETAVYFSWQDMERQFFPGGEDSCNIIASSVDAWAADLDRHDHPALLFASGKKRSTWTYGQLREISCRWAVMLQRYGFGVGDRLMVLLPPCPETWFAMAACARIGVVFCPVFATSTLLEIETRMNGIQPKGVLTTPDLAEKLPSDAAGKIDIVFLQKSPAPGFFPAEAVASEIAAQMPAEDVTQYFPKNTPLYMIFTSGATRPPKGIIHCHGDMTGIYATAKWVLDIKPDTVLWTDADPAWVTGTVYGAFAPWLLGITSVAIGDGFSPAHWYYTLESRGVSTWYTSPRVLSGLMEAGEDLPRRYDLSALRHLVTVGAPLVPETLYWCRKHLGATPRDTWWMTETGVICIANTPAADIKPGSMGRTLPGIEAAVFDDNGNPLPPMSLGDLALKTEWPGMMTGIFNDPGCYATYFSEDGWFLTGDMALADEEGYFYHHGRTDDLLKTNDNKLIGPFEIEQFLCTHPAVAEAAVIAKGNRPGESVSCLKAFITPEKGYIPSSRLAFEIEAYLRGNLASGLIAGEVEFLETLPRTLSGKLLRRVLRARELGVPGGEPKNMQE